MDKYFDKKTGHMKSEFIVSFLNDIEGTPEQKLEIEEKLNSVLFSKLISTLQKTFTEFEFPEIKSEQDIPVIKQTIEKITSDPRFNKTLDEFFSFGIKVELDQLKS